MHGRLRDCPSGRLFTFLAKDITGVFSRPEWDGGSHAIVTSGPAGITTTGTPQRTQRAQRTATGGTATAPLIVPSIVRAAHNITRRSPGHLRRAPLSAIPLPPTPNKHNGRRNPGGRQSFRHSTRQRTPPPFSVPSVSSVVTAVTNPTPPPDPSSHHD